MEKHMQFSDLSPGDREIISRIEYYIALDLPLAEKLRLARLIALMDLEYDEVNANRASLPARDVLRVSDRLLAQLQESREDTHACP